MTESAEFSADRIADALGRSRPTPQQRAVIESPLAPALVVAGAGSGKTETMASRVLWLLANGFVEPAQILGLTFTRRAAGELRARIRDRIAQLTREGLLELSDDPLAAPTISTYNSYANAIYRDNSLVLGRESDGSVLGEAAAWQLARSTILRSTDARLLDVDSPLDSVTDAVLRLARAIAENGAEPAAVCDLAKRFGRVVELPLGGQGEYADVEKWATTVGSLDTLVSLAGEYDAAKLRRGFVEYSDQVALALEVVRRDPSIARAERERFRVVLLDEYQDTSVGQTALLAAIFGGHAVMAVGDPNQSIYGWRGASASNLNDFATTFRPGGSGVGPGAAQESGAARESGVAHESGAAVHAPDTARFALSVSWRNGTSILDAANAIVAPLAATVEPLTPSPTASANEIDTAFPETVVEEADAVADWLQEHLVTPAGSTPPTAAILFRKRSLQSRFVAALRARGIKFHVLGISGLLSEPEIADLVSALTVVHDPSAGLELIRLLAGSRWRIGVSDLHALNRLAGWLRRRDYAQHAYDDELAKALSASVAAGEGGSIVDALDFLGTAAPTHSALADFSDVGLERLRQAARTLAHLRSRVGLPVPDFVAFVLQELRLDIEVAANDARVLGSATFDAFYDALDSYLTIADSASLGGFLSWLRAAEQREDLSPRPEDPEPGTVQLLTIHGAKGLEWDLVAVPRLVKDELPGKPINGALQGWLGFGQLPWPFRGDADSLPQFDWQQAATRKELVAAQKDFSERVREHLLTEERRLAYVAITRARHHLLLTGSFWATQKQPRPPSTYLRELESAAVIPPLPNASEFTVNPLGDQLDFVTWPFDPLGERRAAVEAAAAEVRAATPQLAGPWQRELELLLEERRRRLDGVERVQLPARVPASRFKDYVSDAASVASSLRRPMPEKPYRATQLGTLFHSWVEGRFGLAGSRDELDAGVTETDGPELVADDQLEALKATFEASPWADRRPVDVEREIHLPFDGRIIVCKIDAVFAQPGERFEIVDWKTGSAPQGAADLEQKQLQLALYRLAYATWAGIDPERIDAVFYYVSDNRVIRPPHIDDAPELLARWRAAFA